MVVWFTVRVSITFEEVPGTQFLVAMIAGKMLRMPGLAQGCDDLANDWLVAGVAASLLCSSNSLAAHVSL